MQRNKYWYVHAYMVMFAVLFFKTSSQILPETELNYAQQCETVITMVSQEKKKLFDH